MVVAIMMLCDEEKYDSFNCLSWQHKSNMNTTHGKQIAHERKQFRSPVEDNQVNSDADTVLLQRVQARCCFLRATRGERSFVRNLLYLLFLVQVRALCSAYMRIVYRMPIRILNLSKSEAGRWMMSI